MKRNQKHARKQVDRLIRLHAKEGKDRTKARRPYESSADKPNRPHMG